MKSKDRVPFLLLALAIIIKFAWFYNMTSVTSNYIPIILITTIFYGGIILMLMQKPWLSLLFASIFTFIFESEVVYFRYFNKLLSFYNVTQVRFVNSVSNVMFSLVRPGDIILLLDIVVLVIILFYNREILNVKGKYKVISATFVVILVPSLTLASFGVDFGVSVMNQEFFMYHTKDGIEVYQSETVEEEESVEKPLVQPELIELETEHVKAKAYTGIFEGKNLITIQVESLQDMVLLEDYEGQAITPFLNSLIGNDSFYFTGYYQQLGKGNTSDSEFSSHNSLYPSMESISYLRYQDHDFRGLPVLLSELGYKTMAFHGNEASFWCREEAYPNQGIQEFYSEERLDIDEVIGMGLTDMSLFRQGVEILSKVTSPYYGFFVTITNHNPYILPEDVIEIVVNEEDKETLFGRYIESVHYTDRAIEAFYNDLDEKGMLDNAVIVIYGDHHGISKMDNSYNERVSEFLGYPYDFEQMMNIPLIIHAPGSGVGETYDFTCDQQDLLPTLVNLFGIEADLNVMGVDMLNSDDHFVLFQTYMITGSFIDEDTVFEMSRDGIFEHGRAWNRLTQELIDVELCRPGYERALYEIEYSRYLLENNIVTEEQP